MRNTKVLDAFNALNKIQALAAAAGFLTSSEEEEEMCFRLVDLIEQIAREAGETTMDKPRIYRTDDDVLLNLQRSLDLMNCAIRLLGSGEKNMQMYVMSLVDVAAHLTQQSTNSLDLGEQADNEHGVCNG
ncbi:TPA: hypothetical protein ACVTEZ_002666 [Salmonella enterica subsp. enterica serovar Weltevreden]